MSVFAFLAEGDIKPVKLFGMKKKEYEFKGYTIQPRGKPKLKTKDGVVLETQRFWVVDITLRHLFFPTVKKEIEKILKKERKEMISYEKIDMREFVTVSKIIEKVGKRK
ncbi:MAG: hypothetical protein FWF97_03675 [Alphaproteobacteria bacterium]|nr:hypothetical protein [Alphaproteobacteria bacterium]